MSIREQRILDKFDETELEYCRNMKPNDRESYHAYVRNHINDYVSPSEWFNSVKKKYNKMEKLIIEIMGNESLEQYKKLCEKDKAFYYSYLVRRVEQKRKGCHMTPKQWFKNREIEQLNTDFIEIAKQLRVNINSVMKWYYSAINKMQKFIEKHPEYKELEEYL